MLQLKAREPILGDKSAEKKALIHLPSQNNQSLTFCLHKNNPINSFLASIFKNKPTV